MKIFSARRAGVLLVAMVLLGTTFACESMNAMLDGLDKPTARITGAKLQDLSLQQATLLFDVEVANPYSVPLPLANLSYALASAGNQFLSGNADVQGTVPAHGKRTVNLAAQVPFAQTLSMLKTVKPGAVVPYEANMAMSVNPPGMTQPLSLPMNTTGKFPIPAPPEVEVTSLNWKDLTFDKATGVLQLKVKNTNQFPVDLSKMSYALNLAGAKIAQGGVEQPTSFKPGGDATLALPITFAPRNLGLAAFNILKGSGADYQIQGDMNLGTPFGALAMPYYQAGKTTFTK